MQNEIERKFLVKGSFKDFALRELSIQQGYLAVEPNTVRVRITDKKSYLTIKGKSTNDGLSRPEWEKEISPPEAESLMQLAETNKIEKTRYIVPEKSGLIFEVDVFSGKNQGLIIAEIELPTEDTTFEKPDWLGKEVTGDKKYYNSWLISNPFSSWK